MKKNEKFALNLKIFILLTLSLTLVFGNTDRKNWKYKDWEVTDLNKQFLRATTHGTVIWGHKFGIIKPKSSCSTNLLWLSMSSTEFNLSVLKNKKIPIEIKVNDKKYLVKLAVSHIYELTPATSIILFENLSISEVFIKDLEKGNQLKLTILDSSDLSKKFDFKFESFSLDGFSANHAKLVEACKDINKL